ncbi:hypothetical protein HNQ59_001210 [Chitinivorax tropicus]|uniref:DUF4241 domain-containing protein n=1 Tax=Chitinivorax tropicus TaxID=714531 RepID=A0A840MK97_9PROT|nr:DUF4241 domain-containing protein [Chitinivorax tropicus]MBB5017925.1 hypothetical protein [Chitinivorax tropicus]
MQYLPIHDDRWKALSNEVAEWQFADGQVLRYRLFTVECGQLWLKSGRLVICDPFATLAMSGNPQVRVAPGCYPVIATIADTSEALDGSQPREAYLSVVLSDLPSIGWRFLSPLPPDMEAPALGDHEFIGVSVDENTVAFTDADAIERLMPSPKEVDWEFELFDSGEDDAWQARLADPGELREGLANVLLPDAQDGENVMLSYAGWGDGSYAVVGTYAADGTLTGVHIDLAVLPLAPMPEWD